MSEKSKKIQAKSKKNLMKMRCCVTPCGQTDAGSSQKTFLGFSRTSKRRQTFHKKVLFFFFGFIQRKSSLSGKNIFSLATHSAIIYCIRSN